MPINENNILIKKLIEEAKMVNFKIEIPYGGHLDADLNYNIYLSDPYRKKEIKLPQHIYDEFFTELNNFIERLYDKIIRNKFIREIFQ